ncbi:AI-2E family transporter [Billgrantia antri]|uniref:AI-2E family transporter n=1 Tax=Billgrantia antri TaxID=2846777 RepID=UPI003B2137DA
MADRESATNSISHFTRRALIVIGLVGLVSMLLYFANQLLGVLLLVFASVLVAVAIDGMVRLCRRYLPLSRPWALVLVAILIVLILVGLGALVGPPLMTQLSQLTQELPQAFQQLVDMARELPGVEQALGGVDEPARSLAQPLLNRATSALSTTFDAITSFLLVLLVGFYLVVDPAEYARNLLMLCPPARRARLGQVLGMQGQALRLWLISRLISMVFIGVLVALGLAIMGVPMAGALGLIAGLFTFIPYLGPILGVIPTVLIAFLQSPQLGGYAVLLYLVIETLESNVVTPLAAKGMVRLPPAYTVVVQLAGGAVAGVAGVMLATPLAVAVAVAVQMLYVEDLLGDEVEVLGQGK